MTDDTLLPFSFPTVCAKKITAAFDGGRITSDGGVMLLAAAERRQRLADRLAAAIHDPRDPARVTHGVADILRARIFAIACGYEDANDLDRLRFDPAFKLACGRLPDSGLDLCSQPTCSRLREAIDDPMLQAMTEPLLTAYEDGLRTLARIDKMLLEIVKKDTVCRLLMTVPGVGPETALTFRTAVDVVHRFDRSRLVAAVFGLTPRVHSSGEMEQIGRISKSGDSMVRAMLYEAANVMMTRCRADNWLKIWALGVARRRGARKAKVALARKLAVILHRMWRDGTEFSMEKPMPILR